MNFRTNIKLSFEQWKFRKLQFIFLTVQIIFSFTGVFYISAVFFKSPANVSDAKVYGKRGYLCTVEQ